MNSNHVGIEEARKRLGDLVTAAQQGADIVITRNGKPAVRLVVVQEDIMVTVAELAAAVGMSTAPEKVAAFAGCFTEPDFARTGRLPKPWNGQGMAATFTRAQADQLIADWHDAAQAAEDGNVHPEAFVDMSLAEYNRREDAAIAEVRDRFRP